MVMESSVYLICEEVKFKILCYYKVISKTYHCVSTGLRTTLTVMIDLELHIHTLLIHPVYIDVDISVSTITRYLDQLFIARLLNVYCEFLL